MNNGRNNKILGFADHIGILGSNQEDIVRLVLDSDKRS